MVYWGEGQDNLLLQLIESGVINPHTNDENTCSITLWHISTASKGRRDHCLRKRTPSHVFGRSSEITYLTELLKGLASELHKVCNFSLYDDFPRSFFSHLLCLVHFSFRRRRRRRRRQGRWNAGSPTTFSRHWRGGTHQKENHYHYQARPNCCHHICMAAASLKPSLVKRYDLSIHFPYQLSPTGYFASDGKRRICVDFISITQHLSSTCRMSACRFFAQTATFCVVSATCRRHVADMWS